MKNLLWAILILISYHSSYAQDAKSAKDTLIWTDGTRYTGTIINTDKKTGQVQFMTEDNQVHLVAASAILQLIRVKTPTDNKMPPVEQKAFSPDQLPSITPGDRIIHWSNPDITSDIRRQRRIGIALTILGVAFSAAGTGMLADGIATKGRATIYSTPTSVQAVFGVGAIGIIGITELVAGLPMMIVGAAKLAAAHKHARFAVKHLR